MVVTGPLYQARNSPKNVLDVLDKAPYFRACVGARPKRHDGHRFQLPDVHFDVPTSNGGYMVGFRGPGDGVGGRLPVAGSC